MQVVLFLVAFFACSLALSESDYIVAFRQWQHKHGRVYESAHEHNSRFSIFRANLDFIHSHDAEAAGFTVALNKFADQTNEEFAAWACGMNLTRYPSANFAPTRLPVGLPTQVDWRQAGAVTPVKNQQQCGSCWSFSATGSMEGAHFLKNKKLVSLSEQNLIDCSVAQGNQGCNGGLMDQAFQYVITNRGIDTEQSYPYTATGPNACQYDAKNSAATVKSYIDVASGDENALLIAVAKTPVSVAIDASRPSFQFYSGGVYNSQQCSSTELDHGVLAIGYGQSLGTPYWLVKNSWGEGWGLAGYIMMSRNANNQCGIATAASYPVV